MWRSKPDSEPYDCSYPQETARDLKKQYLPIILVFLLIFVSGCASGGFNSSGVGPNQQFLESCEGTDFGALASASKEQVPREAGTGIVPYNEIRNIELFKHQIPVGDDLVRAISEICPGVLLVTFNQGRSYIYEENSDKLFQFAQLEIPQSFVAAENDFVNFFNTPQRRIDLGLRDVIVNDNKLFFSTVEFDKVRNCIFNSVYSFDIDFENFTYNNLQKIYESTPCVSPIEGAVVEGILNPSESGGRMQVNSDGEILLTTGHLALAHSYASDGAIEKYEPYVERYIDNPDAHYGAIINIGSGEKASEGKIFAKGFRNPQGLTITDSGQIYVSDHGPRGGDELNLVQADKNYGWPHETYGIPYDAAKEGSPWKLNDFWQAKYEARSEKYEQPLLVWKPAIAPSQIVSYNFPDGEFEDFNNELVLGTLKDLSIRIIKIQEDRVIFDSPIYIGERVRDIHAMSTSGVIYAVTDTQRLVRFKRYDFELPEE